MNQRYRIPTLRSRVDAAAVSVGVCHDPGPEVLARWDALVAASPRADVTQLSAWAHLRAMVGYQPLYLLAWRGRDLVGGAQILQRRFPVLGSVAYLPYGPLIASTIEGRGQLCGQFADALAELALRRVRMLFVQPPEDGDDVSSALLAQGFRPSCAEVAPSGSLRIDLTVDETVLRQGLSRRLRTWTNQWPARGVTVRRGNDQDLGLLIDLIAHSADHHGYEPLSADYLRALYRLLEPARNVALFIGEVHNVPMAAELYTACGDMLRLRLRGLDRTGHAARLSVPAAITWEAMRWAKASGLRWFDFGGLRAETLRALLDGETGTGQLSVDRFKTSFGGTAYRYPQPVEMIQPSILRACYDLTRRWPAGRHLITRVTRMARGALRARPPRDRGSNS